MPITSLEDLPARIGIKRVVAWPETRREALKALQRRQNYLSRFRRIDDEGFPYVPDEIRQEQHDNELRMQQIESLGT